MANTDDANEPPMVLVVLVRAEAMPVCPRGAAAGTVEVKRRATGERQELSLDAALAHIG